MYKSQELRECRDRSLDLSENRTDRPEGLSLLVFWCFGALVLFLTGCVRVHIPETEMPSYRKGKPPIIRVLLGYQPSVSITSKTHLFLKSGRGVYKIAPGIVCKIISADSIIIGIQRLEFKQEIKISSESNIMEIDGKPYRGEFRIYKSGDEISIVNAVDVESYLKGVVPLELGTEEIEALKAQAVAARCYALAHRKPRRKWDIVDTIEDQVYGGITSEKQHTNKAIEETYGVVCTYKKKIINAKYSSTCGGSTADGDIPYLKRRKCRFCEISPHYKWSVSFPRKEFFSRLDKEGKGKAKSIQIKERDKSGRIKSIKVRTSKGNYFIKNDRIRTLLQLKSHFFTIKSKKDSILIQGRGFGHGIGMCQWGAIGMAKKGYSFEKILKYYYRGVRIEKIY